MKNILFITGSLAGGGAERMVTNLANSLSSRENLKVYIIIFNNVIEYSINPNVEVIALNYQKGKNKIQKIISLRKAINRVKPDSIICFLEHVCMGTIFATKFTKYNSRIITTIRNNPKKCDYSLEYQNDYLSKSKKCIFQNIGERNCFPKIDDNKCVIIPNYYNQKFENSNREYNSKVKTIISVGRLEEQKNFKLLIDAIDRMEDKTIHLQIVGKGSLKDELLKFIESKNLLPRVSIIDWTNDVKGLLDKADLFVMSSLNEGMPNALMEAMISGIPCISTDCDFGPSDIIDNGTNGLLVRTNDIEDLTKSINYAINNYDKMIEMSRKAIIDMKSKFSEEIVLNKWYKAILDE